jgi:acyl dehydratase
VTAVGAAGSDTAAAIMQAAGRIAASGDSAPRPAPDPVNLPMIRHWTEAMGDANPVYTDAGFAARSVHGALVAPPAMTQVWTMRGLGPAGGVGSDGGDPLSMMSEVLDEAGFTSVVATNCEQEYHRYLRPGEQVTVRSRLESVTGPKQTALGEGWFVTTRSTWYVGTEAVASMMFRVLKYRPPGPPGPAVAAAEVLRPAVSRDTAFFWAGTAVGELRIQRCGGCGALRHPPGPM